MNTGKMTTIEQVKPDIQLTSDIFGSNHIMIDGRTFITINYIAPWIDNAGMRSLSNKILALLKGVDGPSCAEEKV